MPHIHEKVDFTVEVLIVFRNKVLLRKHDKYKIWLSVGGHIEIDEDPNQAAIREVKEEIGIDVKLFDTRFFKYEKENYKELIPPAFLNRHRINEKHEHVTLTYFATSETDKLVLCEDEKTEECKWFSYDELESEEIPGHIKAYAKKALEVLSTKS
jgi:8-oxo-dGTP pyrophosphatase MutT (NUDIX family)